jgi:hypothetical protein
MDIQREPGEDSNAPRGMEEAATGVRESHGRRYVTRTAGVLAVIVCVVALVVGVTAALPTAWSEPIPVAGRSAGLHLPRIVNAPGAWSDDESPQGPLAAIALATRNKTEGLTGRREQFQLFGVSAADGHSAWINLPGVDAEDRDLVGWFALSPDGRWIGWSQERAPRRPGGNVRLLGWAVMDTTTGKVRRVADPAHRRLRETVADLAFSADSQYLLTSYETPHAPRRRGHQFVAWDVHDGTPTVLEKPGHYWLPNLGSAPASVVWSRRGIVYRDNLATGQRSSYAVPQSVIEASWGPDDTAFAYIGTPLDRNRAPWRLYAGRTLAAARDHAVPIDVDPGQLLGWRDDRHVVVGHFRSTVHVVDVVTGDFYKLDMAGYGKVLNAPLLADDLWQNPLTTPAEPTETTDPRAPFRWAGGTLLALLALTTGAMVLRRKQARA